MTPEPSYATGKICYLEIPCDDPAAAAAFYADVFGWRLRERGDGSIAFDDAVGQVSGTWVTGPPPSAEPGIVIHVMVGEIGPVLDRVRAGGGSILRDGRPGRFGDLRVRARSVWKRDRRLPAARTGRDRSGGGRGRYRSRRSGP